LPPGFPEGDLRWTPELIQAETNHLPELDIEVSVGLSGVGRGLAFAYLFPGMGMGCPLTNPL
jgi:hypothetical protein